MTLNVKFGSKKYAEKWEFRLASIYKDQNGKFLTKNLDLPICLTGCHTDG